MNPLPPPEDVQRQTCTTSATSYVRREVKCADLIESNQGYLAQASKLLTERSTKRCLTKYPKTGLGSFILNLEE
ncbi:hypothetical protein EYF80_056414 [Liparis tanakae]|uniref:Uncharacterized protein n=1 Tax=Liparis tanakae TaxID=230148 RepID=A0A4Z2EX93_9TELE|nr:hypothetical protein EYF80_056414 [Liparis tanakae]